jgi:hypothetical protein
MMAQSVSKHESSMRDSNSQETKKQENKCNKATSQMVKGAKIFWDGQPS